MAVKTIQFEDLEQPWRLQKTEFDRFNLLVGLSGVGKSRLLRVLGSVGRAARGEKEHGFRHCQWTVEVDTDKGVFSWVAKTVPDETLDAKTDSDDQVIQIGRPSEAIRFAFEEIRQKNGEIIARRGDGDSLFLFGKETPRLRSTESMVSLLDEEPISTIRSALTSIHFSRTRTERGFNLLDQAKLEKLIRDTSEIEILKQNRSLDLMSKAYVLKRKFPEQFNWVAEQMTEIFDTVGELDIGPLSGFSVTPFDGPLDILVPAFRERGVDGWIHGMNISSGMLRTLKHLLELQLEPSGSVLLIDEYENGMGVNCLPQVTELILQRTGDLQLIFTSHHPFVIDTISKEWWKVMRRIGHEVHVSRARDIERLNTTSNQDTFIQLINAPEYLNGLQ